MTAAIYYSLKAIFENCHVFPLSSQPAYPCPTAEFIDEGHLSRLSGIECPGADGENARTITVDNIISVNVYEDSLDLHYKEAGRAISEVFELSDKE